MNFFIKRSSVTLDCFTSDSTTFESAQPNHSIKFIPTWWKNIPNAYTEDTSFYPNPTAKKCAGIIGWFSTGLMVPMWSDLNIEVGPIGTTEYRWQYSDRVSELDVHHSKQLSDHVDYKSVQHFKLKNPWLAKCKEDIKWFWLDPIWTRLKTNDFIVLPGVTSFLPPLPFNINLFVYRSNYVKVLEFKFGQPILQIVPLTEKKLEIKHHLVTPEEMDRIHVTRRVTSFIGRYNKLATLIKGK